MVKLKTWAERSNFTYTGSVKEGTKITYGKANHVNINSDQYMKLLKYFSDKTVSLSTSRTNQSSGSVGQWLVENITKVAIASYVGVILLHEGYAEKVGKTEIKFNQY